ncbi:MAG: polyhydroxyalkanoic acid system family protein [Acidobacteriota bacterium]
MKIEVPHKTSKDAARRKVEERIGQLLSQFGGHADEITHEWLGDTLTFKGKAKGLAVAGTVEVTDQQVVIDGKLPLVARMFEGRIREALEREAKTMFG